MLCSIYAGINLLRLAKEIPADEFAAWEKFKDVIRAIPEEDGGDLVKVVTSGVDPADIPWIMLKLDSRGVQELTPSEIQRALSSSTGVLIFIKKTDDDAEEPKTHYTVVRAVDESTGDYILFDSYGFERLVGGEFLEGDAVQIEAAWVLADQSYTTQGSVSSRM